MLKFHYYYNLTTFNVFCRYTDLEQDREALYFANARRSDALVEKCAPSLQSYLITLLGQLLGDSKIKQRTGWCGPGKEKITIGIHYKSVREEEDQKFFDWKRFFFFLIPHVRNSCDSSFGLRCRKRRRSAFRHRRNRKGLRKTTTVFVSRRKTNLSYNIW